MSGESRRPLLEVRRRAGLLGAVGGGAALMAAAYVVRATGSDEPLDWLLGALLAVVALGYLGLFADSRSPLVVVDSRGVRARRWRRWRGLPWAQVQATELRAPASWWRDGRLVVSAVDPDLSYAVRLGLATVLTPAADGLDGLLAELSSGTTESAAVLDEEPEPEPVPVARVATGSGWRDPRPRLAAGIGSLAARLPRPRPASATVGALALAAQTDATQPLPELEELRRADDLPEDLADLAAYGEPGMPADAHATQVLAVTDPVVGPMLIAARQRLSLSVAQVAERTRIPAEVVEAVEADDFTRCGGDFYARGHLRTLARVLGIPAPPLVAAYDERYAQAPATAGTLLVAPDRADESAPPARRAGSSWSVLVAAVMAVVLAWSLARLVLDQPVAPSLPPGLSNGSGGVRPAPTVGGAAVPVLLRAAGGGARVSVRDGNDKLVFTGDLAFGATRSLSVRPPVRVQSSDGSLEVVVDGTDRGALGDIGQPAAGTFLGG